MSVGEKIRQHKKILATLITIIVGGSFYGWDFYTSHKEISETVQKKAHPATSKEEDLRNVSQKLDVILEDVQSLKKDVDEKRHADVIPVTFGINDADLAQWEISMSGKNVYHLKENEEILITNNRSPQQQSAHFIIKNIYESQNAQNMEMFITTNSALFLGVVDPNIKGKFELSIQKIPK